MSAPPLLATPPENAAAIARAALTRETGNVAGLMNLADLCRRSGALAEAGELTARALALEPGHERAAVLNAVLSGKPAPASAAAPSPFIRLTDFLPGCDHAWIKDRAFRGLDNFIPAPTLYQDVADYRPQARQSVVHNDATPFWARFSPFIKAALVEHGVAQAFGMDPATLSSWELQVTGHGDGAFFERHVDDGAAATKKRLITFVYYFHANPRRFTGGDLLLFDGDIAKGECTPDAYTRVSPDDNSLVFFPSRALHEVDRVTLNSGELCDGRFTLNGWVHDGAAA